MADRRAVHEQVRSLLEQVGLGVEVMQRFAATLSGGERQRVAIARALGPGPKLLVCDEPFASLDTSTQAQIINLLVRLRAQCGLGYLLISHDLDVVRLMADRVAVMPQGRIAELGPVAQVLGAPHHDYTRALLGACSALRICYHPMS